jgi:hypothetical protein
MDPTQIPLRDLHLPMTIGWWPLAPGWWILIGIAMAGLGWLLYRAWMSFRRNRPRRIALKKLSAARWHYEYGAEPVALATEVSDLLRRAMLAYAPRSEIAGLTGSSWLQFLDRGLETPLFSEGAGGLLETLPYVNPQQVSEEDVDLRSMLDAVKVRLKTPLSGVTA